MAKKQKSPITALVFPVGGLNRRQGFDQTPPYTTPYCFNVRPYDPLAVAGVSGVGGQRLRGGARPGLVKSYSAQLGAPGLVQMLAYSSVISAAAATSNILLAVSNGNLYQGSSLSVVTGYPQFVSTIPWLRGTQVGQYFYFADYRQYNYAGQNAAVAPASGNNQTLTDSAASFPTFSTADYVFVSGANAQQANIFPIVSNNGNQITYYAGSSAAQALTTQTAGVVYQVGRLPQVFNPASPTSALTPLMGSWPLVSNWITAGNISISATGVVTGSGGASFPQVGSVGAVLNVQAASGIGTVPYLVASWQNSTQITLADQTSDAQGTYANGTWNMQLNTTINGIPPLNCPLCCTYRGRLVFAGSGAVWYMSRVLVPTDWDYGYDPADPSRAVAGTSTTTGGIPDPILALIPHSDDYLIFGCDRSMWILTGDAAYGGTITALSRDIGVMGPGAWCTLPDSSIVFLSRDGIYQIQPGGSSYPMPISRALIPSELLNIDYTASNVSMAYDLQAMGIHISITPIAGGTGIHYFLDWTAKTFWPVTFGSNSLQPTAMLRYSATPTQPTQALFGCLDGYVRNYSNSATNDDGTAINSLIAYGPFRIGGPGYDGQIINIAADLDVNSAGVTWSIYGADSAEAAVAAAIAGSPSWTGTWSGGRNSRQYPMARGYALTIVLTGTSLWAVEEIRIEGRRKGLIR